MNVLIFEYKNIGIEDICEALKNLGHSFKLLRIRQLVIPLIKNLMICLIKKLNWQSMIVCLHLIICQLYQIAAIVIIYHIFHTYMIAR